MSASERSICLLPPRRAMRNQEKSPSEDRLQLFSLHTFSPPRLTRAFMSASERLIPIMHMPSMPRSMPSLLEDSKEYTYSISAGLGQNQLQHKWNLHFENDESAYLLKNLCINGQMSYPTSDNSN